MADSQLWLPSINFDPQAGFLSISGRSIPVDPQETYSGLLTKLKKYVKEPAQKTTVHLELEYINTSSVLWIYNIVAAFEPIYDSDKAIDIQFHCPDSSIEKTAQFIASRLDFPVKIVKVL